MSKQNNSTQQSKELTQTNTTMSPNPHTVDTTTTQLANLDIRQDTTAGIPNDVLPEDLIVTFDDDTLPDFDRMWDPNEPPPELEFVDGGDDWIRDDDAPVGFFVGGDPGGSFLLDTPENMARVQQRLDELGLTTVEEYLAHATANGANHGDANPQ